MERERERERLYVNHEVMIPPDIAGARPSNEKKQSLPWMCDRTDGSTIFMGSPLGTLLERCADAYV